MCRVIRAGKDVKGRRTRVKERTGEAGGPFIETGRQPAIGFIPGFTYTSFRIGGFKRYTDFLGLVEVRQSY